METTSYELKYCERCGTLKLRRVASESTYCRGCESLLTRFTFPRGTGDTNSTALPAPRAQRRLARIPVAVVSDRPTGSMQ